jgi:hypothetical protein
MTDNEFQTGKVDENGRLYAGKAYAAQNITYQIVDEADSQTRVYYIRHGTRDGDKFGTSLQGMEQMVNDGRIAIDWGGGGRLDHAYYQDAGGESAVKDVKAMQWLDRNHGRVVADYPYLYGEGDRQQFLVIGDVLPSTHLRTVEYEAGSRPSGDSQQFLGLQLENRVVVTPNSSPDLFDVMPLRRRKTIRRSNKYEDLVHETYNEFI